MIDIDSLFFILYQYFSSPLTTDHCAVSNLHATLTNYSQHIHNHIGTFTVFYGIISSIFDMTEVYT